MYFGKITSILIFLILYIVVLFLAYQGEIREKRGKSAKSYFVIIVVVLCFFSSIRGENVGTDYKVYAKLIFQLAGNANSMALLIALNTRFEIVYLVIAYIVRIVTDNIHVFMFFIQLICTFPIYVGIYKKRNEISITYASLAYICLLYPMTFNAMRQNAAMALLFLGSVYLFEKRYKTAVIWLVISTLFHSSAIFSIALVLFIFLVRKVKNRNIRSFLTFAVPIVVVFLMINWNSIAYGAIKIGILPERYAHQIAVFEAGTMEQYTSVSSAGYVDYLFRIIFVAVPSAVAIRRKYLKNELFQVLKLAYVVDFLMYSFFFFSLHTIYGYRIVMIYDYLNVLLLARIVKRHSNNKNIKGFTIIELAIVAILIAYFVLYYGWYGAHQVIPFSV